MSTTVDWTGKSGKKYTYHVSKIDVSFKNEAGNYLYAKETSPGLWKTQYIGQTDDLGRRLSNHEKETCAIKNGATHIHSHTNSNGEKARKGEETDLILQYLPPCNEQGK